ncbi:MAG: hypothetical protein Tsb0014_45810 [Pleurocapsa sp.]
MSIKLKVPDMACGACAETITKAVLTVDPKASVKADTKTKQVMVETQANQSSIKDAIAAAGYTPS